jgi:hypothetical protein
MSYTEKGKVMKNRKLLALVAAIFLGGGSASAGLGDWFYGESWKFMEAVGGVAIGQPSRKPQSMYLSVRCDVSGLTEITKKPTTINSAISVKSIKTKIEEQKIYISVRTGLVSKNETCMCSGVDLGDIPAGNYEVIYYGSDREQHSLGSVVVPPK